VGAVGRVTDKERVQGCLLSISSTGATLAGGRSHQSWFAQIGGAWLVGAWPVAHMSIRSVLVMQDNRAVNPHNGYVVGAQREATTVVCVG
jgi:hypothetical protein